MKTFRTFHIPNCSEVVQTPTGPGFRRLVLEVVVDQMGEVVSAIPIQVERVEGAPDPGGEATEWQPQPDQLQLPV